ncbi:MAG: hypothetical protein IKR57_05355 [Bacilli bacterium]|nr:hypothetical protein [Bacilli bacterium]
MHIDFYGEIFDKYERFHSKPYLGFFSPKGDLVDYNTELGGSHGNLGNLVSWTFLLWIKQNNIIKNVNLSSVDILAYLNPSTGGIKNADIACYDFNVSSNLTMLQKDLLNYLDKVGDNDHFIELINKRVDIDLFPKSILKDRKISMGSDGAYEIEKVFGTENTRRLLMFLKDICIQHLGYDAIERIKPNNEEIVFPQYFYLYPDDYMTYFDKPRIISSTYNNVNERFYNYLLMDWVVKKMNRYLYNEDKKEFVVDTTFFESDRDADFKSEIETIKKHVPIRERIKYFR